MKWFKEHEDEEYTDFRLYLPDTPDSFGGYVEVTQDNEMGVASVRLVLNDISGRVHGEASGSVSNRFLNAVIRAAIKAEEDKSHV